MTAFDRFEQRVPELMDELAPARIPDYFDDLLLATAHARQRPAWTSLERWLPVQLSASSLWLRRPATRPIVILAVAAAVLLTLAALLAIGSKPKLPALFGPARNGLVVYSDQSSGAGDIYTLDPASGKRTLLIGGAGDDLGPVVSPDGRRLLFARLGDQETFYTARIDGSDVRMLVEGSVGLPSDWSPDGTRILVVPESGGDAIVVDVATGARTPIHASAPVTSARWLADGRILLAGGTDAARQFATIAVDGSAERRLSTPKAAADWDIDAAGGRLAWVEWDTSSAAVGVLHVLTIATGVDQGVTANRATLTNYLRPMFSPNGRLLTAVRHGQGTTQLVLLPADGASSPVSLGPAQSTDQAGFNENFAPDGTTLIVGYDDGAIWQFAVPAGSGQPVSWPALSGGFSWQRVGE